MDSFGKIPPSDSYLEKSVLGTLMTYPQMFGEMSRWLGEEVFYENAHGKIYAACYELFMEQGAYDVPLLLNKLREMEVLDECGGEYYILQISNLCGPSTNLERYCMILHELFIKRSMLMIFMQHQSEVFDGRDILDIYDDVKKEMDKLFRVKDGDINKLIDYEASLLSCALQDENVLTYICDRMLPVMFYKNIHKDIFVVMTSIMSKGENVCLNAITDQLQKAHNDYAVLEIGIIADRPFDTSWNYKVNYVVDKANRRRLYDMALKIIDNEKEDPEKFMDELTECLDEMRTKNVDSRNIKSTIRNTMKNIRSFSSGEKRAYILSGYEKVDNVSPISPGNVVVIGGAESSGKTRWTIDLMKNIMSLNRNMALMWYTMEDPDEKIIRAFIAGDVGLDDMQMTSKNYKLSEEQITSIELSSQVYEAWDIEFINESVSINMITSKFRSFCRRRKDKCCICIVDNFMLIQEVANASGNQTAVEDSVMSKLRNMMSSTNKDGDSILFLLHHISKEASGRFNKDECYRPKLAFLKGTTRIYDTANIVFLINNMAKHKDLIKEHDGYPDIACQNERGEWKYYKRSKILSMLLIIDIAKNRDGDINDDRGLIRILRDFAKMKFIPLIASKSIPKTD